MNLLASHNWWHFRCILRLLFNTHFDDIFPVAAAESGRTLVLCFLELVPWACHPDPPGSVLAIKPSSAATAYDRALHTPEFPTADTIFCTIRHGQDSCWRVVTIRYPGTWLVRRTSNFVQISPCIAFHVGWRLDRGQSFDSS